MLVISSQDLIQAVKWNYQNDCGESRVVVSNRVMLDSKLSQWCFPIQLTPVEFKQPDAELQF